jgi:hypothetical protein
MPIKTKTVLSIEPEEVLRVDAQVTSQTNTISGLLSEKVSLLAEIDRLKKLIPGPPPPPPPDPVPGGLRVTGGALVTAAGLPVQYRGIECMWGPISSGNAGKAVEAMRAFGANAIGPLFQRNQSTASHVRTAILESESRGMMCAVNADHTGQGRSWLKQPPIVAECNEGKGVILQCEVELGDKASMTAVQWRDLAITFVKELRAAGHKAPIRVGSPSGGRSPSYALEQGAAVLKADPLASLIFTWQAYWDRDPSTGWEYATSEGFARGTEGALQCAERLKASGLCWLVGLDGADDIGPTPYMELAIRLHELGIAWQWWAMQVNDAYGNGLVNDPLTSLTKPPFGGDVKALLKEQGRAVKF